MSDSETEAKNNNKRAILTLIKHYKAMPCLWNNSDERYNNKDKRNEYYEKLLEKYRVYKPKADLSRLKNKIQNLRACYAREHKRVIQARFKGHDHEPMLWYYKHMEFLNKIENDGPPQNKSDNTKGDSDSESSSNPETSETPNKKRKTDVIYIKEERYDDESNPTETNSVEEPSTRRAGISATTFGRLVGIQLSELNQMQRVIAEKLISEIMFFARIKKLSKDTQII